MNCSFIIHFNIFYSGFTFPMFVTRAVFINQQQNFMRLCVYLSVGIYSFYIHFSLSVYSTHFPIYCLNQLWSRVLSIGGLPITHNDLTTVVTMLNSRSVIIFGNIFLFDVFAFNYFLSMLNSF